MPAPNGTAAAPKLSQAKSRGALKRLKAKQAGKKEKSTPVASSASESEPEPSTPLTNLESLILPNDPNDPAYSAFANVFAHFQPESTGNGLDGPLKPEVIYSDDDMDDEEDMENAKVKANRISKKEKRRANRLSVAELKQLVEKPEIVEWTDCDARDPRLLVNLKGYRNTIPVPAHWSAKRDYLSGKKGMEKVPFQLPPWIADTGIGEQRDAVKEKEANQTLKQKTRERVQPKMGKIDIDYQKLHDAFFKYQRKPLLSKFGEAYYEGKELETDLRMKKPGEISDELKDALSIPPLAPPPWLIAMQRYGPPPSYPNLRIKGLNAPIPEHAQWGFHPGGWGKPPMDEFNRPLYGDVFTVQRSAQADQDVTIQRDLWGEIEPAVEESEDEEDDEEEMQEMDEDEDEDETASQAPDRSGLETPSGMATPSGMQSVNSTVPGGLETPDFIDLRKKPTVSHEPEAGRDLYQVVPERDASSKGFMGSSTAYDIGSIAKSSAAATAPVLGAEDRGQKRKAAVEISMDMDTEDLTQADLQKRYDAERAASGPKVQVPGQYVDRSEFDDVIQGETSKRARVAEQRAKSKKDAQGKKKEAYKF